MRWDNCHRHLDSHLPWRTFSISQFLHECSSINSNAPIFTARFGIITALSNPSPRPFMMPATQRWLTTSRFGFDLGHQTEPAGSQTPPGPCRRCRALPSCIYWKLAVMLPAIACSMHLCELTTVYKTWAVAAACLPQCLPLQPLVHMPHTAASACICCCSYCQLWHLPLQCRLWHAAASRAHLMPQCNLLLPLIHISLGMVLHNASLFRTAHVYPDQC